MKKEELSQHIATPHRRVGTEPEKTARDREAALAAIPPPFADVVSNSEWENFNRDLFGLQPSFPPNKTQDGKEIQSKPLGDSNQ